MNGFLNVIKPVGATASDVVVCLKHVFHCKKIGHLGTLDPGASGVLPIAVGGGTKLFDFLTNKRKYYRAFFTFGKTTDTLDSYGGVVESCDAVPTLQQLQNVLPSFLGEIDQVPPLYSAISVGGVRSYKLARSGQQVQLKSRKITIYKIEVVRQESADTFVVDIECSGGTYIRSIARDVAVSCNTVGYMSALIRLKSGCFNLENALTLDHIKKMGTDAIVDIMYPLQDVASFTYPDKFFDDINFGRKVPCLFEDKYCKLYCKGVFFGLATKDEKGNMKLQYYLKDCLD